MRGILIFIPHFTPLKLSGSHWTIPVHGFFNKIGWHCAELDLMADLLSRIFEVKLDLSTHVASLSRFQVLAIIIILSSNDILHEL